MRPEAGTFFALRSPPFRRIWAAQFIGQLGFWVLVTARAVLVFEITGSAGALGIIYFFTFIPQLLLGPVSGVLADRYDRRRILMFAQSVQAAGAAAIGVLAATDTATLFNLSVLSVVLGSMQTIITPATNALMPSLVDRDGLASAVTLTSAMQQVSRVLGPLAAALLIPAVGLATLFYANALSGVAVLAAWWYTPVGTALAATAESVVRSFRRGFAAVRRAPDLWVPILMVAVLSAVGLVYQPLGVAYATDVLAGGDQARGAFLYGVLQTLLGAGAAAGVLGTGSVARRRPGDALMLSALGFSLGLVALGATDDTVGALTAATVLGGFHFANLTIAMNLVQHQVSETHRGRVMSIFGLAFVGIFPISSMVAGMIADAVGVSATFVGAGLVCTAFSLFALRWRRHVRMDGTEA